MGEFNPVRETFFIATATILAGVLAVLFAPTYRELAILAVLGFVLFVFLTLVIYLSVRGVYTLRKEG